MPRQRPRVHWLVNNQQASQFADRRNRYTLRGAYIRGDLSVDLHKGGRDRSDHVGGRQMIEAMGLGGAVSIDAERVLPYADAQASASDGKRDMPPQVMSKSLETGFRDFRLHWKKVVGEGGYGLITLWEVELEDGHREDVIIKMGRTSDTNLHEELSWHLRYNLASSIVQARDLVKMADRHRRGNRFRRGEEFSPRRENVLVLEYMSLGNLCSVFQKTKMLGRQFPSNALWQLWECLVLGIAEVAYQEVIRQHYNQGFTGAFRRHIDAGGQFVEEFFDAVETFPISHDVHFDLEENNILVSQDDQGRYIFKLHDFGAGWSKEMRQNWNDWAEEDYWKMRQPCKYGRHLPEQNAKEWDSITRPAAGGVFGFTSEDFHSAGKNKVAGRYGSWTNIYTIARTLETAITLYQATHPFVAKRVHAQDPNATYGWRVSPGAYPHVDPELISIMQRCMREHPPHRGSTLQLLREIKNAREAGKMDTDNTTGDFWDNVMQPVQAINGLDDE